MALLASTRWGCTEVSPGSLPVSMATNRSYGYYSGRKLKMPTGGKAAMKGSFTSIASSMVLGGLLIAAGIALGSRDTGAVLGSWTAHLPGFSPRVLHAATATSGDSFALATGLVDENAEGVFVLDFLTGSLQCSVLNHRTGRFAAQFKANVAKDLGVGKNPTYQMVTGFAHFNSVGGVPYRPGRSVVYVLDTSSGRMVAYGIPWQRNSASNGRVQIGLLQPIDALQVRNVPARDG